MSSRIHSILLPAYEKDFLPVFIGHFVIGSFSGTHDKFFQGYAVKPRLNSLKEDECMLCGPRLYFSVDFIGLVRLLYYLNFKLTNRAVDISWRVIFPKIALFYNMPFELVNRTIHSTFSQKRYCSHSVHLSLRLRTIQLIKSNPIHCVLHLRCPEIRQIYGLLHRVGPLQKCHGGEIECF